MRDAKQYSVAALAGADRVCALETGGAAALGACRRWVDSRITWGLSCQKLDVEDGMILVLLA